MHPEKLPLNEFFRRYELERFRYGFVDVRSEGEFANAALPGFANLPILTDSERHQVGLTYKQRGQEEAARLGHELVNPERPARVAAWKEAIGKGGAGEGVMICWRGGMRSQIAAGWTLASGTPVSTVDGGIKAIRGELLKSFEPGNFPKIRILAGLTGSGKTELLKQASCIRIDLERIANHRGSSFGRKIESPQPAQATFENELALELRRIRRESTSPALTSVLMPVLMEDESTMIGSCFIPRTLKTAMSAASCVWVESPVEERACRIYREYVLEPLDQGFSPETVRDWMAASLERIRRKLGGLETTTTLEILKRAFADGSQSLHVEWIAKLLVHYYDPMYRYGFEQCQSAGRTIAFRGTTEECLQWLKSN